MIVLYTTNEVIETIRKGFVPAAATGCDTLMFSSAWKTSGEQNYYLNMLATQACGIILGIADQGIPDSTITRMLNAARVILGNKLKAVMLRDEPPLDARAELEHQIKTIRAVCANWDYKPLIGINTTILPVNAAFLALDTDFHSIDHYYNWATPYGSTRKACDDWEGLFLQHAPTKPMMFIGQAHTYRDTRAGISDDQRIVYPIEEVLPRQLAEAKASAAWHRISAWCHYVWRPPMPTYEQEWPHEDRLDLAQKLRGHNVQVMQHETLHPITQPVRPEPPPSPATVVPASIETTTGRVIPVRLVDEVGREIVKVATDPAYVENIPPGLKQWTVNTRNKTGDTAITYTLSDGTEITQSVRINPAAFVVNIPPGTREVILRLQ